MSITKQPSRTSGSDSQKEAALVMPRNRGAVNGSFLALLGLWGVLIPFIGHTSTTPSALRIPGSSRLTGCG